MVGADTNLDRLAAAVDRAIPANDVSEASSELACIDEVLVSVSRLRLAVARPPGGFQPTWMAYSKVKDERVLDYVFGGGRIACQCEISAGGCRSGRQDPA